MKIYDAYKKLISLGGKVGLSLDLRIDLGKGEEDCIDGIVKVILEYKPKDIGNRTLYLNTILEHPEFDYDIAELYSSYSRFRYDFRDYYNVANLKPDEVRENFFALVFDILLGENHLRLINEKEKIIKDAIKNFNKDYDKEKEKLEKELIVSEARASSILDFYTEGNVRLKKELLEHYLKNKKQLIKFYDSEVSLKNIEDLKVLYISRIRLGEKIRKQELGIFSLFIEKALKNNKDVPIEELERNCFWLKDFFEKHKQKEALQVVRKRLRKLKRKKQKLKRR